MEKSVHTPEYRFFRAALREMRISAGLSQRDLANRLSAPHSWVAKVESGERRVDIVEFCWFALACDADPIVVFDQVSQAVQRSRLERQTKEGPLT